MSWLSIWLIPVLLIFILVYLGMKKGQSLEEYVGDYCSDTSDAIFCIFITIIPFINIITTFAFGMHVLYEKLKHLRK